MRDSSAGRAWLERLPGLLEDCRRTWSLTLGDPFPYAFASLAVPAVRLDGEEAVLKIQFFPDRESEHEAAALEAWAGEGAVRLLAHDPDRHALLLERCMPGTPLTQAGSAVALDVLIELLPRLWIATDGPFRSLEDEAAWWVGSLADEWARAGRPCDPRLLDAVLEALDVLPPTQGPRVLVNQDLHADNVLRAARQPWLVIDPKPLVGEREFGIAAPVRGGELGEGRHALVHRLDRLTEALGLDRDRARRWAMAQTFAWAFDDGAIPEQLEIAAWLMDA